MKVRSLARSALALFVGASCFLTSVQRGSSQDKQDAVSAPPTNVVERVYRPVPMRKIEDKFSFPSLYQNDFVGRIDENRDTLLTAHDPIEAMNKLGERSFTRSLKKAVQYSPLALRVKELTQDHVVEPIVNPTIQLTLDGMVNTAQFIGVDALQWTTQKIPYLGALTARIPDIPKPKANIQVGFDLTKKLNLYESHSINGDNDKMGGKLNMKIGFNPYISYELHLMHNIAPSLTFYTDEVRAGISIPIIDSIRFEGGVSVDYPDVGRIGDESHAYLGLVKRVGKGRLSWGVEARIGERKSELDRDSAFNRSSGQSFTSVMGLLKYDFSK